jgi:hypothetical protein
MPRAIATHSPRRFFMPFAGTRIPTQPILVCISHHLLAGVEKIDKSVSSSERIAISLQQFNLSVPEFPG